MSIELGNGGSLPTTIVPGISIPESKAVQGQLQQDSKVEIYQSNSSTGDTYKLMSSSLDSSPGYLSSKINTDQFNVTSNKLTLIAFGSLNSDDLSEGEVNFYFTEDRFNSLFGNKNSDDISEGATNKYYTETSFNSSFGAKTTNNLLEGTENLYFTEERAQSALYSHTSDTSIHLTDLGSFTTDDLSEGAINLYLTSDISDEISANTSARHTHDNKSTLDTYNFSNDNAVDAIDKKHSHSNSDILDGIQVAFTTALYNKYESYSSNLIASAVAPLNITDGVLSHTSTDGYKHVPSNSSASQYDILISGASAGIYSWENLLTTAVNVGMFESTPSTSINKTLTSAYINTHISNETTDVKHLTDDLLAYISSGGDVPLHIASTILHVPSFTDSDNGKFLYINNSTELEWTTSSTNIQTSGAEYISASGDTITAIPIRFIHTAFVAGDNITIDESTDEISASWRPIDNNPTNGNTDNSISSNWAYEHEIKYGNSGHIPTSGTSGYFLSWDGTFRDISEYSGTTDVLDYALAMQEDNTLDPGISPTIGDRYIILDSSNLNSNFGTISGIGDNDIVEYSGSEFVVSFDASAATASVEVTVTTDINGTSDEKWYYSVSGLEWRDRGVSGSLYWSRDSSGQTISPSSSTDNILMPLNKGISWDTGVSYIRGTNTNIIGIYTASVERLQINASSIIANLPITVDIINETTSSSGVTIDGVLNKDSESTANIFNIESSTTRIQKDGSGNITFTDSVSGTITLASLLIANDQLVKVGSSGTSDYLNAGYFDQSSGNHIRPKIAHGKIWVGDSDGIAQEQIAPTTYSGYAAETYAATEKTTIVDADLFGIVDSEASNVIKKTLWATIKSVLLTYFSGIFTSRNYVTPTVSSSTLTFDFGSLKECYATKSDGGSITGSGAITIAYSNADSFKTLWFAFQATTEATLTFPTNHISGDSKWASLVLTLPTGYYQISVMYDGAKYHVVCSNAEV